MMLLTYSLKTGLNHRGEAEQQHQATAAATTPCEIDDGTTEIAIMPLDGDSSSPFDCWAQMVPRRLEDGVPSPPPTPRNGSDSRRRSRPQHKVLFPSDDDKSQPRLELEQQAPQVQRPAALVVDAAAGGVQAKASFSPRRRKGVHFPAESERIYLVPSHSSYSPDERADTWYTRDDLYRMKHEAGLVVDMMRRGEYIDEYSSSTITTRGLERHASESIGNERRERKFNVVRAVLTEQHRQRVEGVWYKSNVRMASVNVSWRSRDLARAAAEWDEYVVSSSAKRGYDLHDDDFGWTVTEDSMPMRRVVSYDEGEDETEEKEEEAQGWPVEPVVPSPPRGRGRGHHKKRSASEAYSFDTYDILGSGGNGSGSSERRDENTPPPSSSYVAHGYPQHKQEGWYEVPHPYPRRDERRHQHHSDKQRHAQVVYDDQYHHHQGASATGGDRYQPLAEIQQAKRSVVWHRR